MRTRRNSRFFAIALAAVALVGGSAFTASNTGIDDHVAGVGSAAVSGVAVDNIDYQLSADRTAVDAVVFEHDDGSLDHTTAEAEVQLASGGAWYTCTLTDNSGTADTPSTIDCDTTASDESFEQAQQLTLDVNDGNTSTTSTS